MLFVPTTVVVFLTLFTKAILTITDTACVHDGKSQVSLHKMKWRISQINKAVKGKYYSATSPEQEFVNLLRSP
jgi:hypothetical protein